MTACYSNYEPGTHYQYSNRGINLLGAVIEKVSGERFDNYVRQHILLPLGITDAGFNVDSLDSSRFASLYTIGDDGNFKEQKGAYDQISARVSTSSPAISSGAAYSRVPAESFRILWESLSANPKSIILILAPLRVTRMLDGFKSL